MNKNALLFPATVIISLCVIYLIVPIEYFELVSILGVAATVVTLLITTKTLTTVIDFEKQWLKKTTRNNLYNEIAKLKRAQVQLSIQMLTLTDILARIDSMTNVMLKQSNLTDFRAYEEQQQELIAQLTEFKTQTHTYEWLRDVTKSEGEIMDYKMEVIDSHCHKLKIHLAKIHLYVEEKINSKNEIDKDSLKSENAHLRRKTDALKNKIERALEKEIKSLDNEFK